MKKIKLLFAVLFTANTISAQIYLEATIHGRFLPYYDVSDFYFDCGKLPITYGDTLIKLYNDDMTLYKTIQFPSSSAQIIKRAPSATKGGPSHGMYLFARNIYTTDGKVAFIKWASDNITIYDEDKTLLATIPIVDNSPDMGLFTINGKWKLIIQESQWSEVTYTSSYTTYVYSLPGNSDAQFISAPSSPKQSSSSRKYLNKNRVMIENGDHTYTVSGQEVR